MLERRLVTLRTEGNQNNEVGLPLTVLRLGPEHAAAVLEMGMYVGGEIRELAAIGLPEIGIVTAVQPVHLSRIGSLDGDRGRQGRAGRGAARRPPTAASRSSTPTTSGCAGWPARTQRPRRRPTASPTTPTCARTTSSRAGSTGMRSGSVTPAGERAVDDPGARAPRRAQRAGRRRPPGWPRASASTTIVPGLAAPSRAAHRSIGDPRRRRGDRRRQLQRLARARCIAALELLAGLPAARRIAVLGEMRELGDAHDAGHLEVGEAAGAAARRCSSSSTASRAAPAAGIVDGALAAGLPAGSVIAVADAADAVPAAHAHRPAGRRRAGQGVAWRRARARRRRPRRGARRRGAGPVNRWS